MVHVKVQIDRLFALVHLAIQETRVKQNLIKFIDTTEVLKFNLNFFI